MGVTTAEVFEQLGDHEIAVVRALDTRDTADAPELASAARLSVSSAIEAAQKLAELGLVHIENDGNGGLRFSLDHAQLRARIEDAPGLFS